MAGGRTKVGRLGAGAVGAAAVAAAALGLFSAALSMERVMPAAAGCCCCAGGGAWKGAGGAGSSSATMFAVSAMDIAIACAGHMRTGCQGVGCEVVSAGGAELCGARTAREVPAATPHRPPAYCPTPAWPLGPANTAKAPISPQVPGLGKGWGAPAYPSGCDSHAHLVIETSALTWRLTARRATQATVGFATASGPL